jgi:hypothetical protein
VLLELFVSRKKKKNSASYWLPCAWLDGLQGLSLPCMSAPPLMLMSEREKETHGTCPMCHLQYTGTTLFINSDLH